VSQKPSKTTQSVSRPAHRTDSPRETPAGAICEPPCEAGPFVVGSSREQMTHRVIVASNLRAPGQMRTSSRISVLGSTRNYRPCERDEASDRLLFTGDHHSAREGTMVARSAESSKRGSGIQSQDDVRLAVESGEARTLLSVSSPGGEEGSASSPATRRRQPTLLQSSTNVTGPARGSPLSRRCARPTQTGP